MKILTEDILQSSFESDTLLILLGTILMIHQTSQFKNQA